MYPQAEKRFINCNRLTIIVIFLVILAGGVVRSTGSGMGCPDWPRCFNKFIPPTHISQLPDGYEQQYIDGRAKKNERFANIVERFGYTALANQIRHDESILVHEEFNAFKTWTEYINRLVGVVVGFALLFTAIFSFVYLKSKPSIVLWSVLNVFVVILQAWLGSIVVSTNLMPWIITVHMLLALLIVAISIYTFYLATTFRNENILINYPATGLKILGIFSLVLATVQIVLGTEVREVIDQLNANGVDRSLWISSIGATYENHRLLAYGTLLFTFAFFFLVKSRYSKLTIQARFSWILLILILIQMLSGIVLDWFQVPAFAQTVHLVTASLFFGVQFYLMLLMNKLKR